MSVLRRVSDEGQARAFVRETQAQEDAHGRLLARKRGAPQPASVATETVREWCKRWQGKVRAGDLSWHTAWNVWAVVSRMFRDATNAKQRDLRVRPDNPARDVAPPDRGARKGKVYL